MTGALSRRHNTKNFLLVIIDIRRFILKSEPDWIGLEIAGLAERIPTPTPNQNTKQFHPPGSNSSTFYMNELQSVSIQVSIPGDVLNALIIYMKSDMKTQRHTGSPVTVQSLDSGVGCPEINVNEEKLRELLQMDLSIPSISKIMGVSRRTICRVLKKHRLSVKSTYSNIRDDQLDQLVLDIKKSNPAIGCRIMKGKLRALGHRITWSRIWEAMRRVDAAGVSSRMLDVSNARAPLSVVHLDTNQQLLRYGFVIFGAIDGFSRKIMYLEAAADNKPSTALDFFLQSVEKHGLPDRVSADHGGENVDIARWMLMARGSDRRSFTSGRNVHNQRVEHLWRDLWTSVTSNYYKLLHCLEEDGLLDASDGRHLFAARYVFLPRLQADLESFSHAWDNRCHCTEQSLTPNQLWTMNRTPNPISPPKYAQGSKDVGQTPNLSQPEEEAGGSSVPSAAGPLSDSELEQLSQTFNPCGPSENHGRDIYSSVLEYVLHHSSM